jgi:hypothetical protein
MKRTIGFFIFLVGSGMALPSFATDFTITPAITGSWYDPAQSGQGFSLEVISSTQMVAYFYTFDPAGNNLFLTGVGTIDGPNATIPLYTTTGGFFPPNLDPTKITRTAWGTLFLNFTDCGIGTAAWTPIGDVSPLQAYVPGTMPISRITTIPGLVCQ